MSNRESSLVCKVAAVNLANKRANELYAQLLPIFAPLVGQPIDKSVGFLAKVAKLLPEFENTPKIMVYRLTSNYSLAFVVKTCFNDEHACIYHETTCYIGEMQGPVLSKLMPHEDLRTDYTCEEIIAKREACKKAKQHYETLRSGLHPFAEEWDR